MSKPKGESSNIVPTLRAELAMSILLIIAIISLIVWFMATRPSMSEGMIADAAKWTFILSFGVWCLSVAGVKVF